MSGPLLLTSLFLLSTAQEPVRPGDRSRIEHVVLEGGAAPWVSFALVVRTGTATAEGQSFVAAAAEALAGSMRAYLGPGARVLAEPHRRAVLLRGGWPRQSDPELEDLVRAVRTPPPDGVLEVSIARAARRRRALRTNERALAWLELERRLLSEPLGGSPETISSITAARLRTLHAAHIARAPLFLAITGALDLDMEARAHETLAIGGASRSTRPRPSVPYEGVPIVVVDKPGALAHVAIGARLPPDRGRHAVLAASAALGGSLAAWLPSRSDARDERTPAVAVVHATEEVFAIEAGASRARAVEVATELLRLLEEARTLGLPPATLERGTRYAAGELILARRDPSSASRFFAEAHLAGLSARETLGLDTRVAHLRRLDVDETVRAMLAPESLLLVIVTGATPELEAGLLALPGAGPVSVVSYEDR